VTLTLDINVLLDVFQKREPHYAASAQVLSLVTSGQMIGVCPAHAFTTLYYLVRKHASKTNAEKVMDQLLDLDLMGCRTKVDWTSQNWVRAAGRSWFQAQWAFLPFQTGRPAARARLASIKRCKRRNIL